MRNRKFDAKRQVESGGSDLLEHKRPHQTPVANKYLFTALMGLVLFASGICVGVAIFGKESVTSSKSFMTTEILTATTTNMDLPAGWKNLYVFTGEEMGPLFDREDYTRAFANKTSENPRWSSQVKQDALVHQLLDNKRNGFFVELAANDAVYLSNSFALEQYFGWDGICIEGNAQYWNHLAFRKCHVIGALVGSQKGEELTVKFSGGETGGIVWHPEVTGPNRNSKAAANNEAKKCHKYPCSSGERRRTTTFLEILDMLNAPQTIDYLSLDVEGAEEYIMRGFPFDKYYFTLMTIERPTGGLKNLLEKHGYRMIYTLDETFGETLWKHKSSVLAKNETKILQNFAAKKA